MLFYLALIVVVAYLIGGIPMGVLVADANKVDIHSRGSGKMGTTNVLRSVGRRAAALVLVGDFLKGSLAVLVARLLVGALVGSPGRVDILGFQVQVLTLASLLAALAAVAGHVWSIYLRVLQGRWRGGRGVATAMGAALVVNPLIVVAALGVGIPTILISRYVSLGSILGTAAAGLAIILLVLLGWMDELSLLFISICVFIILAHRDNIERLTKGTERKIGEQAKTG
ncbi:MAG: glycerol-3-phosphate 1-O-acyltransferase PlsY [Chloroflexota bacterium]|nr:glycerol-3-phosphate 1-O-acyltransferase PlsY [Chloroflexota bacterium]MDQ5864145.1 glycerol-3-phosphate 1-O-acyltransferase PlsY [Chloroflexota bacterium]